MVSAFRLLTGLALFLFQAGIPVYAQSLQGFFRNYTVEDGLSSNDILCVAEDHRGVMWIGSSSGLSRYDGYNFEQFHYDPYDTTTISGNHITALHRGKFPYLWVGTFEGGLCRLNTITGEVFRVPYNDSLRFPSDRVLSLSMDQQGYLWVGMVDHFAGYIAPGDSQVVLVKPKPLPGKPVEKRLKNVYHVINYLGSSSLLWMSTNMGLILVNRYTHEYAHFRYRDTIGGHINEDNCRNMIPEGDSVLWIASWGGGILKFNYKTRTWKRFLLDTIPPLNGGKNIVKQVEKRDEETFWVATHDYGLGIFNLKTGKFRFYLHDPFDKNSPLPDLAYNVYKDSRGIIWICIMDGLSMLHESNQHFPFQKLPFPQRTTLKRLHAASTFYYDKTRERLLMGANQGDGLYVSENGITTIIPVTEDNTFTNIYAIIPYKGTNYLIAAGNQGLFTYTPGHKKLEPFYLEGRGNMAADFPWSLIRDNAGHIYIGTFAAGIFRVDKNTGEITHYKTGQKDGSGPDGWYGFRNVFKDSRGQIWYSMYNGVCRFDPVKRQFSSITWMDSLRNLPMRFASGITETPDGKIWIASNNQGLLVCDPQKQYAIEKIFSRSDGLYSTLVEDICTDHQGNVWVTTMLGLSRVHYKTYQVKNYQVHNGLKDPALEWGMQKLSDGNIAVGMRKGYTVFSPDALETEEKKIPPVLLGFYVNSKRFYPEFQNLRLDPDQNLIRILFSALPYAYPGEIEYMWMMKGLSDQWQPATENHEAVFLSMPAGHYTFLLKYRVKGESWSEVYELCHFSIRPEFWQTWWFRTCCALVFMLLVYMVYRARLKQIRRREKVKADFDRKISEVEMKALRAQMNPHFLFNSLNSIRFFIMKNQTTKAADHLTRFSQLIRLILQHSKQEFISLEDELHALKLYIELEQARFEKTFDFQLEIAPGIQTSELQVHPMLLQPYVENAIWHGLMHKKEKGKLTIRVYENARAYYFEIMDNGIGRARSAELKSKTALHNKSYGMQISHDRIDYFNKFSVEKLSVEIIDLWDDTGNAQGTLVRIILTIPDI